MTALLACALYGVTVLNGCPESAARWAPVVQTMPADHWALVTSLEVLPAAGDGAAWSDGRMQLGSLAQDAVLPHELGHILGYAGGGANLRHWLVDWWGGRNSAEAREDLAWSYLGYVWADRGLVWPSQPTQLSAKVDWLAFWFPFSRRVGP